MSAYGEKQYKARPSSAYFPSAHEKPLTTRSTTELERAAVPASKSKTASAASVISFVQRRSRRSEADLRSNWESESSSSSVDSSESLHDAFDNLLDTYALPNNLRASLQNLRPEQKSTLLAASKSPSFALENTTAALHAAFASTPGGPMPTKTRSKSLLPLLRGEKGKSPTQIAKRLSKAGFRSLTLAECREIRVLLKTRQASWAQGFLNARGYERLCDLLEEFGTLKNRSLDDELILQQLALCLRALMTQQHGIKLLLENPKGIYIIRNHLLTSAEDPKRKQPLELSTRKTLLEVLCAVSSLHIVDQPTAQASPFQQYPTTKGYDLLYALLQNSPSDTIKDDRKRASRTPEAYPFPMSFKSPIQASDFQGPPPKPTTPRFAFWMRELNHTIDKHIEPITFLAGVLDYRFDSIVKERQGHAPKEQAKADPFKGSVMVDEGVIEYLITNLNLMRIMIETPPSDFYANGRYPSALSRRLHGQYNAHVKESIRIEFFHSGFDRVVKNLVACPHPFLSDFYGPYLMPLLHPMTGLAAQKEQQNKEQKQRRSNE